MLVVYLSNRYIRVVEGDSSGRKLNARALYYTVDTKACILNGMVMDAEAFGEIITELWESNKLPKKGIHLVIDSSQFTTKVTDVPIQKPRQMMQFVTREFSDVDRISNPVYGYFPLPGVDAKKSKTQTVFAMMTSREYIGGYVELFGKLGITVDSVECAMGAALRLVNSLSQVNKATGIIQFVDDMMLINILVINGVHVYSSRNRLFSDAGTVDFAIEIAHSVSSILQFTKAQNIPVKIEEVYVAGLRKGDMPFYADSIQQIDSDIRIELLKAGEDVKIGKTAGESQTPADFAIAIGGLIRTDAKTNIMSQVRKNPELDAKKRARRRVRVPLCVVGGIIFVIAGVLGIRTLQLIKELKETRDYNNRADVVEACEEYDIINSELRTMNMLSSSMAGLKGSVLAYPRIDSSTEQTVEACAAGLVTAEISGYNSEDGVMSFNTSAANVEQIHQFVDLLSRQSVFEAVDYTGYTQGSDGQWNVKVNCIMKGRQEETDEADEQR